MWERLYEGRNEIVNGGGGVIVLMMSREGGGGSWEWLVGETKSKTRNEQWKMGGLLGKERIIKEKKIYLDGIRPIYMAKGSKISTDVVLVCADIRTKS